MWISQIWTKLLLKRKKRMKLERSGPRQPKNKIWALSDHLNGEIAKFLFSEHINGQVATIHLDKGSIGVKHFLIPIKTRRYLLRQLADLSDGGVMPDGMGESQQVAARHFAVHLVARREVKCLQDVESGGSGR